MSQMAFYFDNTRCTGCKTCVLACKDYNNLDLGTAYRKVYEVTGGATECTAEGIHTSSCYSYNVSMACNHCENPACVRVCPTGAMHKDDQTGLVAVDADRCVGCGYCHMACPYNAPKVDRQLGHSVKCDGCASRVAQGDGPICVQACPTRALAFGTSEEMAKLGERGNIAPLPESSYTNPNLYIKASADANDASDMSAKVVNPLEVM